jgi:hypothetical protein
MFSNEHLAPEAQIEKVGESSRLPIQPALQLREAVALPGVGGSLVSRLMIFG